MKKILLAAFLLAATPALAVEDIKLPAPDTTGGMPLMEAITQRKTTREFSPKAVEDKDLSNILYAAWGISHDGKRTIPTSQNKQDLNVYVIKAGAIWKYIAPENTLKFVSDDNVSQYINLQDYTKEAPITLIFTGNDVKNASMNAAAAYQNVGLYCASRGLNNVVRGYVDMDKVAETMNLDKEKVVITQVIGWPYM